MKKVLSYDFGNLTQKRRFVFVTLLIWVNAYQCLNEEIPSRKCSIKELAINEETPFMSWRRSAFNEVNNWAPIHLETKSIGGIFQMPSEPPAKVPRSTSYFQSFDQSSKQMDRKICLHQSHVSYEHTCNEICISKNVNKKLILGGHNHLLHWM